MGFHYICGYSLRTRRSRELKFDNCNKSITASITNATTNSDGKRSKNIQQRLTCKGLLKRRQKIIIIFLSVAIVFLFCELIIYYFTLLMCKWPSISNSKENESQKVYAMVLADTHLLGPFRGHWFDKLRREWQMNRAFQAALTLFRPEVVFILGDIFDEGYIVNPKQFNSYVLRFYKIFHVPDETKLISLVGNHDIGFHYRMHPYLSQRFEETFSNTGISMYTIKDVHFVTINSMTMENDGCTFCESANHDLLKISSILNCTKKPEACKYAKPNLVYSQPIILQHFPTYRESDLVCLEHDSPVIEQYRENWEVLSKKSTEFLGQMLQPRLAFSGHSHHFCRLKNHLNIEEFTISSFNWRNKNNPAFLLGIFTQTSYAVSVCYMPQESTVINIYKVAVIGFLIYGINYLRILNRK